MDSITLSSVKPIEWDTTRLTSDSLVGLQGAGPFTATLFQDGDSITGWKAVEQQLLLPDLAPGAYALLLWDSAGCSTSFGFTVQERPQEPEAKDLPLVLYPNPATDFVLIEGLRENEAFRLVALSGQVLGEYTASRTVKLNLAFLPAGLYLLEFYMRENNVQRKLIIL
jgi:hypothetical protein